MDPKVTNVGPDRRYLETTPAYQPLSRRRTIKAKQSFQKFDIHIRSKLFRCGHVLAERTEDNI